MAGRALVEELVKSVVEFPDQVTIEEEQENGSKTYFIHCAKEDVGKIIGKSGRVVSAIRLVVSAVSAKSKERAFVKIVTES